MHACVTDERGVPFRSYIDLVQFAVGKEAQSFALKRARTLRLNAASMQDEDDPAAAGPSNGRRRRAPAVAAALPPVAAPPVAAAVAAPPPPVFAAATAVARPAAAARGSSKGAQMTKFGCAYDEYSRRMAAGECLRCCSLEHRLNECSIWRAEQAAAPSRGRGGPPQKKPRRNP